MNENKKLEDKLFWIGIFGIIIFAFLTALYFCVLYRYIPQPDCTFKSLLGIYCPGCGGTRAFLALIHFHPLKSLMYHPLVLYTFVLYFGFVMSHLFEKIHFGKIKGWKFHNWYFYGAICLLVVNWICKNIMLLIFQVEMI